MVARQKSDRSLRPWRLLSSHGLVLFYIGVRPECTVAQISAGLSVTDRTVYGILGDLRQAGMVDVRKEGRRHHYSVNYDAIIGQSVVPGGAELRHALKFLISRTLTLLDEDADGDRPSGAQGP